MKKRTKHESGLGPIQRWSVRRASPGQVFQFMLEQDDFNLKQLVKILLESSGRTIPFQTLVDDEEPDLLEEWLKEDTKAVETLLIRLYAAKQQDELLRQVLAHSDAKRVASILAEPENPHRSEILKGIIDPSKPEEIAELLNQANSGTNLLPLLTVAKEIAKELESIERLSGELSSGGDDERIKEQRKPLDDALKQLERIHDDRNSISKTIQEIGLPLGISAERLKTERLGTIIRAYRAVLGFLDELSKAAREQTDSRKASRQDIDRCIKAIRRRISSRDEQA